MGWVSLVGVGAVDCGGRSGVLFFPLSFTVSSVLIWLSLPWGSNIYLFLYPAHVAMLLICEKISV